MVIGGIFFPISSPGALWTTCVEETGFQEGTLMALATASLSASFVKYERPKTINNKKTHLESQKYVRNTINDILNYTINDVGIKFNFYDERFTENENKISMIMKIIQTWSLEIVDECIEYAIKKYGIIPTETCIALSGGYALNCPTNTYISHKYGFKEQLINPSVNDGGQSIGSGLRYFYNAIPNIVFNYRGPYLGNKSETYDECFSQFIDSKSHGLDQFVEDVLETPIVWFCDRAEKWA